MSKQRQRGTSFESSLLPLLRLYYPESHRLGMQGAKDRGDFYLPGAGFVLEAKNYANYAGKLSTWIAEAEAEAQNAGKPHAVLCVKRKGTTDPSKQYALTTLGSMLDLIHGERP